ncbi:enoyl-(acyl carrier protein) reductase-like protein 6 [Elsinoe australis]|uniref:Enoyl-(Acyl carrier protein) reductase-like protein 6 n=1 Tax=Elsinoe australis TaxID=40998 RepID=A0A4U7AKU0_9PEZI|nr:enoyl-(acyl carrier protein) reductase-like protein 6 [Elsinoe australis]
MASQRPNRSLAGTVAIVTGAGSAGTGIGNGRAAAILLAEAGASVVCIDLNLQDAQTTVDMIKAESGPALALQTDVTSESECESAVRTTIATYSRLDILVNNVGIGGATGTAVTTSKEAWTLGLEINVTSMMLMAKYAIPEMLHNRTCRDPASPTSTLRPPLWPTRLWRGSIVNMGSVAGLRGGTPHLLYPTAKGAVVNMTRAMAAHHAEEGIRVNCVCPGMLYTPMMYGPGMSEETREARKNRSLLKTEGTGWDAGAAIRFLAGDESRWLTGVVLPVDAGATCATSTDIPRSASVGA